MKKGFTLIELLIVISIIGILAVALLPNILSAPATARDAGRKTSLNNVLTAMEQYKATSSDYPTNTVVGTGEFLPKTPGTGTKWEALTKYFKGATIPQGSDKPLLTGEKAFNVALATTADSIAYCRLGTNAGGYSYVVAIRLEQGFQGDNALKGDVACSVASPTPVLFKAAGESNWYFLMQ